MDRIVPSSRNAERCAGLRNKPHICIGTARLARTLMHRRNKCVKKKCLHSNCRQISVRFPQFREEAEDDSDESEEMGRVNKADCSKGIVCQETCISRHQEELLKRQYGKSLCKFMSMDLACQHCGENDDKFLPFSECFCGQCPPVPVSQSTGIDSVGTTRSFLSSGSIGGKITLLPVTSYFRQGEEQNNTWSTTSHKLADSSKKHIIGGAIVGGLLFLALIVVLVLVFIWRYKRHNSCSKSEVHCPTKQETQYAEIEEISHIFQMPMSPVPIYDDGPVKTRSFGNQVVSNALYGHGNGDIMAVDHNSTHAFDESDETCLGIKGETADNTGTYSAVTDENAYDLPNGHGNHPDNYREFGDNRSYEQLKYTGIHQSQEQSTYEILKQSSSSDINTETLQDVDNDNVTTDPLYFVLEYST